MAIPQRVRFQVLARDGFTCRYCGRSAPDVVLHVDHRHPVSLGGDDDPNNLVTACRDCNLGKSNRVILRDKPVRFIGLCAVRPHTTGWEQVKYANGGITSFIKKYGRVVNRRYGRSGHMVSMRRHAHDVR